MKPIKLIFTMLLLSVFISVDSCGPVIVSTQNNHPNPPWFYPNRVINLRYIYFPDYVVYYDLTYGNYIYLDQGVWVTVKVLPPRFNTVNFKHEKRIRVNNYFDDNIREYHIKNNTNVKGRRSSANDDNTIRRRSD